jgi:hypothetical protein
MDQSRPRWTQRLFQRGILPLLVLIFALPAVGIASAALFDSSLVPWFATGGAGETASSGGSYTLNGAAGMAGAHLNTASGSDHTLYGGYVPAQGVPDGSSGNIWLPIIAGDSD